MGNFEVNTLALLGDAEYSQRRKAVGICTRAFMNSMYRRARISWYKNECQYYKDLCWHTEEDGVTEPDEDGNTKKKYKQVCHDIAEDGIWTDMISRCVRAEVKNDGVVDMAKAALALFRRIGITEAFEAYEETVADLLGVDKRGESKAKGAIKTSKKTFKEKVKEKMEKSKADGVLPKETPIA